MSLFPRSPELPCLLPERWDLRIQKEEGGRSWRQHTCLTNLKLVASTSKLWWGVNAAQIPLGEAPIQPNAMGLVQGHTPFLAGSKCPMTGCASMRGDEGLLSVTHFSKTLKGHPSNTVPVGLADASMQLHG